MRPKFPRSGFHGVLSQMKTCITCQTTHPKGLFCDHGHVLKDEASEDTLVGRVLEERYEVRAALGGGGFGMVYLGAQLRLQDRPCVVKVARPELAQDAQFAARFEREKRALMALRSRNTVQILDYGRTDDAIDYIVMEFIEGDELGHLLRRRGPMQPARVLAIARGICNSLIEAHAAGILHRDLKPGNVMLVDLGTSELVKVIDFGIARLAGGERDFNTRTGELPGTPAYSPYEQLIGQTKKVDERTDIYSFGAILYEALTGVVPYGDTIRSRDFDSNTLYFLALAQAKAGETPTPPSRLARNQIPPLLEQLVVSMLHKTRDERPASAQEVMEIIQRIERIGAAGDFSIESDETAMAPLSTGRSVGAVSDINGTQGDASETLDSVPEEVRSAPPAATAEPLPQLATAQPELPAFTQLPAGQRRGLVYGGGVAIVLLLAVISFLVFAPGEGGRSVSEPMPPSTPGAGPVTAHPAGIPHSIEATEEADIIVSDMVPSPAEVRRGDASEPPEVTTGALTDAAQAPDVVSPPDTVVPHDLSLPDSLSRPQDTIAPEPVEVVVSPTKPAPPDDSAAERRRQEERRERRKREQKRLDENAAAKGEEAQPAVVEKVVPTTEKKAATTSQGEPQGSGVKAVEEASKEKPVEVKKEEVKVPPEEKKALHKRLDFMDDEE